MSDMMWWEYLSVRPGKHTDAERSDFLTYHGEAGWELVQILDDSPNMIMRDLWSDVGRYIYVFKKQGISV